MASQGYNQEVDGGGDNNHDDNDDEDEEEEDQCGDEGNGKEKPMIALDELPSSTKLETMYLQLDRATVRLPSTVAFASLRSMEVAADSSHHFARFLSSACCPHLQKLNMWNIRLPAEQQELLLEAGMLLELSLEDMEQMKSLELRTPNLLDLRIKECNELEVLTVSAPTLEELTCLHNIFPFDIHGDLPSVWSLNLDLCSHGDLDDDDLNDTSICLLKRCSSARELVVYLEVLMIEGQPVDIIKDRVPQLNHVTSLVVHVHFMCERHDFGDGVASLLTRFSNLRYLGLLLDEVDGYIKKTTGNRVNSP